MSTVENMIAAVWRPILARQHPDVACPGCLHTMGAPSMTCTCTMRWCTCRAAQAAVNIPEKPGRREAWYKPQVTYPVSTRHG